MKPLVAALTVAGNSLCFRYTHRVPTQELREEAPFINSVSVDPLNATVQCAQLYCIPAAAALLQGAPSATLFGAHCLQ